MKTLIAALVVLLVSSSARADMQSETLRGLTGVALSATINGDPPPGITVDFLKTTTGKALAASGIRVLGPTAQIGPRDGMVFVVITSLTNSGKLFYSIRVMVMQKVSMVRNPEIKSVVGTWEAASINATSKPEEIVSSLRELLTGLTGAWRAVNPDS